MKVRDLMSVIVLTVTPDTPVSEAHRCLWEAQIRHLPVTDGPGPHARVLGIVTEWDIRLHTAAPAPHPRAHEPTARRPRPTVAGIMRAPALTIGPDRDVREAARLMVDEKIGALPVLEDERLVGIVTETDVLRAFAEAAAEGDRR